MMVFILFYFIPINLYIMSHAYNNKHGTIDLIFLFISAFGKLLLFGVELVQIFNEKWDYFEGWNLFD